MTAWDSFKRPLWDGCAVRPFVVAMASKVLRVKQCSFLSLTFGCERRNLKKKVPGTKGLHQSQRLTTLFNEEVTVSDHKSWVMNGTPPPKALVIDDMHSIGVNLKEVDGVMVSLDSASWHDASRVSVLALLEAVSWCQQSRCDGIVKVFVVIP